MTSSNGEARLYGTPRLHPEDTQLFQCDPFQTVFGVQLQARASRSSLWQEDLAAEIAIEWADTIHSWVWDCIAMDLEQDTAALLFVRVLWLEYQGSDSAALELLLKTQVEAVKDSIGPEVNVYDQHDFVDSNLDLESIILDADLLEIVTTQVQRQCSDWNLNLRRFFCLDSSEPLVDVTVTVAAFIDAVKTSGLSDSLEIITDPYTRREVDFPIIQLSDGLYHWREFLGEILHRWTPEKYRCGPPLKEACWGTTVIPPNTFVGIMCDPRFIASMTSSAQQVYFLSSLENWIFEFDRWVAPTIRSLRPANVPNVNTWNIERLFRDICDMDLHDGQIESASPGWTAIKSVLLQAKEERLHLDRVNAHVFRPLAVPAVSTRSDKRKPGRSATRITKAAILGSPLPRNIKEERLQYDRDPYAKPSDNTISVCPTCTHKDEQDRCVRRLHVKRLPEGDLEALRGALLTCAPPEDVLQQPGSKPAKVVSPVSLNFQELIPRDGALADCGKDVTLIIDDATSKLVGGAQFNPWDQSILDELCANHVRPGDGYGPYAHQSAQDTEGIKALFAAGRDSDTLMETVRGFAPQVVREIKKRNKSAGINRMGWTGMNSFYCWEYAAPLHKDDDDEWSIACQLLKACKPDECNFAYAEWGVYIRTQANCIWFFDPKHLHGTVLPRQSSMATAISRGIHTTVRRKDIEKARLFLEVRNAYNICTAFWKNHLCS
ncbi:hypothetical protein FB451DRAFT_1443772 [Mycena latifolia]|nr:hypothetical protein FB451DRAFT_1443772 [Mycena latifolia]